VTAQSQVYLYNQRTHVVLLDVAARGKIRYNKVYAKELTLNRGIDNLIEFAFLNQEQKPVNISNKEITARIIDASGKEILLQKSLVEIFPLTGIAGLRVTSEEMDKIKTQLCYYSLEIPVDEFDYPVFVDANCGARGVIRIVNSVLPMFVGSYLLTIPSHPVPVVGTPITHYSSSFYTKQQNLYTFQLQLNQFTGTIQFQGSTLSNFSQTYNIGTESVYVNDSGNHYFNIDGYHPFIRLKIVNSGTGPSSGTGSSLSGDLTKILVR
jgi:hypothetical protein